jgi:hypothetical protein
MIRVENVIAVPRSAAYRTANLSAKAADLTTSFFSFSVDERDNAHFSPMGCRGIVTTERALHESLGTIGTQATKGSVRSEIRARSVDDWDVEDAGDRQKSRRETANEMEITHNYIALLVGVRRPGITTALHVLEGEGLIRSTRGIVTIRNRKVLEALAGGSYGIPEREYDRLIGH